MELLLTQLPTPEIITKSSEFAANANKMIVVDREAEAVRLLLEGHTPTWMRSFHQVTLIFSDTNRKSRTLLLKVLRDYLTIGTDDDCMRMPLSPMGAQKVADAWGCMMPTTKLVNLIWHSATSKVPPQPWGPPYDASMHSMSRYVEHDKRIDATLKKLVIAPGSFIAGHKKDVVMSNRLVAQPKQVAIYGWTQLDGKVIQPLSCVHENSYSDYAHGIRLVAHECMLDGQLTDLRAVLQDPIAHVGISNEGTLKVLRQPGT